MFIFSYFTFHKDETMMIKMERKDSPMKHSHEAYTLAECCDIPIGLLHEICLS